MNGKHIRQRIWITGIFLLILILNILPWSGEQKPIFMLFAKYDPVAVGMFAIIYVGIGELSFFRQKNTILWLLFFLLSIVAFLCSLPIIKETWFIEIQGTY